MKAIYSIKKAYLNSYKVDEGDEGTTLNRIWGFGCAVYSVLYLHFNQDLLVSLEILALIPLMYILSRALSLHWILGLGDSVDINSNYNPVKTDIKYYLPTSFNYDKMVSIGNKDLGVGLCLILSACKTNAEVKSVFGFFGIKYLLFELLETEAYKIWAVIDEKTRWNFAFHQGNNIEIASRNRRGTDCFYSAIKIQRENAPIIIDKIVETYMLIHKKNVGDIGYNNTQTRLYAKDI